MATPAPRFANLDRTQQEKVDMLQAYLHHNFNPQDSREVEKRMLESRGGALLDAMIYIHDERLQPLKKDFARKIFTRGLYAAADSSQSKVLKSEKDGVAVMTLTMAGRMMITLSAGTEGKANYRQITFKLNEEDPSSFGVNSYYGRFADLQKMIDTAAKRFVDITKVPEVMQPDAVGFAGVSVGTPRPKA